MSTMLPFRKFNTRPSHFDRRDYVYSRKGVSLENVVDLRQWDTSIENQKNLGSCVGSAIVSAYEMMLSYQFNIKSVNLSKLYTYYHARLLEGNESIDEGVEYTRNGLKGVQKFGICDESLWPYNEDLVNVQPELECYIDAWTKKIPRYESLYSIYDMLEILNGNMPIVIGITVFDNFRNLTKENPIVSAPRTAEEYGGHAMCVVGYNMSLKLFIVKNSYGQEWGDKGYCYIPFDYMTQYAFDKWIFYINPDLFNVVNPPELVPLGPA